jgi:hypothetical protein
MIAATSISLKSGSAKPAVCVQWNDSNRALGID